MGALLLDYDVSQNYVSMRFQEAGSWRRDLVCEGVSEYRSSENSTCSTVVENTVIELDAFALHGKMLGFEQLCDRARVEFLRFLAIFDEGRRYTELGFASSRHYLVQELKLSRSEALERLRVARKLSELPQLCQALAEGDVRWSAMKCVSRVATAESEGEWLELCKESSLEQVQQAVRVAVKQDTDRPAEDSAYGLRNLLATIRFDLSLEEKARFDTAMALIRESMGEGAPSDLASVVTFLSQQILEGQGPASTDGATENQSSLCVVYQQCPDCRRSSVFTEDGLVEVAAESVDRQVPVARITTISHEETAELKALPDGQLDVPNSAALARKVRDRDGGCCANPGCDARHGLHDHAIQAHHIQFRRDGGRTCLDNEIALCRECHTLIHAGLVNIERDESGALLWSPKLREIEQFRDPIQFSHDLGSIDFAAVSIAAVEPGAENAASLQSSSHTCASMDTSALIAGLQSLGYAKKEAASRIHGAIEQLQLQDSDLEEDTILGQALRAKL